MKPRIVAASGKADGFTAYFTGYFTGDSTLVKRSGVPSTRSSLGKRWPPRLSILTAL